MYGRVYFKVQMPASWDCFYIRSDGNRSRTSNLVLNTAVCGNPGSTAQISAHIYKESFYAIWQEKKIAYSPHFKYGNLLACTYSTSDFSYFHVLQTTEWIAEISLRI